jgi:adenylate cyclase
MSDEPRLIITDAEGQESTCLLGRAVTWKIGRGPNNNVVLDDHAASRRHAIIQRTEMGDYYLMDVGSQNGTFLGSRRVGTPILLNDGDEITVGAHKLKFLNPTPPIAGEAHTLNQEDPTGTNVIFAERLVTVLVVDIRGFTQLTQQVGQDVLCKFITRWFSDASGIFRGHGSWALKYIGDAVMGAWLHDPGKESEPVLAALAAVSEFAAKSCAVRYSLSFPVRFGAGVNTGLASVGNAGSGDQTEFTAFGDAVNAAFRIEAVTREIGTDVAIGQRSAELLGGDLFMRRSFQDHLLTMKGYDRPASVWAGSFDDLRKFLEEDKVRQV